MSAVHRKTGCTDAALHGAPARYAEPDVRSRMTAPNLPPLPRLDLSRDNLYGYPTDQMRAYGEACAAAATQAEREMCARVCEDEARLWEVDGKGPATEARLCAARIRSRA